jgi:lysyl-tRNA synthetase class I
MKIKDHEDMEKYLARREPRKVLEQKVRDELKLPKDKIINGPEILSWINYNNKIHGNNTQPITTEEKRVAENIEKSMYPKEASELQMAQLEKRIANARAYVTKPKEKKEQWQYASFADGQKDIEEMKIKDKKKIIKSPEKDKKISVSDGFKKSVYKVADRKPIKELLEIEDWLNAIDPYWWLDEDGKPLEPKPTTKEETKLEGIKKILLT